MRKIAGALLSPFHHSTRVSRVGRAVIGNQNRNTGRAGVAVYKGLNNPVWEAHLGYAETVLFIQGLTVPEAGRWDHVVVTWDGVNTRGFLSTAKTIRTQQAPSPVPMFRNRLA